MPTSKTIDTLFQKVQEVGASDIHIIVGKPPLMRLDGKIMPLAEGEEEKAELSREEVQDLVDSVLTETQRERYVREREIDLSYQL